MNFNCLASTSFTFALKQKVVCIRASNPHRPPCIVGLLSIDDCSYHPCSEDESCMLSRTRMDAKKSMDDDLEVHPFFILQHRHQVIMTLVDSLHEIQLGETST